MPNLITPLVERVAAALAKNDAKYRDIPFFMLSEELQNMFRSDARAALDAILGAEKSA